MKKLSLPLICMSVLVLSGAAARANEILDFSTFKAKRDKCASYLKKNNQADSKELTGELIHFSSLQPEFQNSKEFLDEMKTDNNWAYFYYADSTVPPFSKYDQGTWSATPRFPFQTDLYILKAAPSPFVSKTPSDAGRWRMDEIRKIFRPVSYTRIRVTPLFSIIHLAIQQVRAVETHLKKEEYYPAALDYAALFDEGPLKYRLVDFVNTWHPTDDQEISAQEIIKALIFRHITDRDHQIDVSRFFDDLTRELLKIYSPELVDSFIGSVESNNLIR